MRKRKTRKFRKLSLLEAIGVSDDEDKREDDDQGDDQGEEQDQDQGQEQQERGTPSELAAKAQPFAGQESPQEEAAEHMQMMNHMPCGDQREPGGKELPAAEDQLARMYGTESLGMLADLLRTVETSDIHGREVIRRVSDELDKMQQMMAQTLEQ